MYLEGTVMGTMVDLGEIASRDPDPKRTKLIFILVERFIIPQLKFYKNPEPHQEMFYLMRIQSLIYLLQQGYRDKKHFSSQEHPFENYEALVVSRQPS